MEDRFRFRAWNKSLKIMLHNFEFLNTYTTLGKVAKDEEFVLMQCTGIKDVKGNLIYEGDILKVVNGSINGIGLSDKWEVKWVGNGWNISQWSFDCTHSYEVIGNIYENKELLEKQK